MSYNFSNIKYSDHPSGKRIGFEDKRHVYFVENDDSINFTSGTSFLKQFFPKFDVETISAKYAAKHGLDQEEVKAMWKEKGRKAADEGTEVHQYMEDLFFGKKPIVSLNNSRVANLQRIGFSFWYENLTKEYDIVEAEKVIASVDLRLAGMVDLIGINKSTRTLALLDWKTNRELKFENPWQTGLGPLLHLQDTNVNHYYLQLNLYQYIMQKEGYAQNYDVVDGDVERVILHMTESGVQKIYAPDMQNEIKEMLLVFAENEKKLREEKILAMARC